MIRTNDLKTQDVACLEENLADQLEVALYEAQQDVVAGRFSKDSVGINTSTNYLPNELRRLCYMPFVNQYLNCSFL